MGTLKMEGKSIREFSYDLVELSISFSTRGKTAAIALEKVMQQGEEFLSILNDYGIGMDQVKIGDDDTSQDYYKEEQYVTAVREFVVRHNFDMKFENQIRALVQDKDYEVEITSERKLSNMHEIQNMLLKEAIEDSKKMAEFIAGEMNKKITGIESIEIGKSRELNLMTLSSMEKERSISSRHYDYSDQVQAPTTEKEARVIVEWIIE